MAIKGPEWDGAQSPLDPKKVNRIKLGESFFIDPSLHEVKAHEGGISIFESYRLNVEEVGRGRLRIIRNYHLLNELNQMATPQDDPENPNNRGSFLTPAGSIPVYTQLTESGLYPEASTLPVEIELVMQQLGRRTLDRLRFDMDYGDVTYPGVPFDYEAELRHTPKADFLVARWQDPRDNGVKPAFYPSKRHILGQIDFTFHKEQSPVTRVNSSPFLDLDTIPWEQVKRAAGLEDVSRIPKSGEVEIPYELTDEDIVFLEKSIGIWKDVHGDDYYVRTS